MALKKVKFTSTVTADFDDLEVLIHGKRVRSDDGEIDYEEDIDADKLAIVYMLSGDNGTDYSIKYDCKVDGKKKKDKDKPSPVEDTITSNGVKRETLLIEL